MLSPTTNMKRRIINIAGARAAIALRPPPKSSVKSAMVHALADGGGEAVRRGGGPVSRDLLREARLPHFCQDEAEDRTQQRND